MEDKDVVQMDGIEYSTNYSKCSKEEAKEIISLTNTDPQKKLGDLFSQWEADILMAEGKLVPIAKEVVSKDFHALQQSAGLEAEFLDALQDSLEDQKYKNNFFKDTRNGAIYSFPGIDVCAFAGYKLLYFKKE